MPSIVVTSRAVGLTASTVQLLTASPSRCTVHAPQLDVSQPDVGARQAECFAQEVDQQLPRLDLADVLPAVDGHRDRTASAMYALLPLSGGRLRLRCRKPSAVRAGRAPAGRAPAGRPCGPERRRLPDPEPEAAGQARRGSSRRIRAAIALISSWPKRIPRHIREPPPNGT